MNRLAASAWSLRRVASSREIRRAEIAWMLGWMGEWAWLVALFVYAYAVGGVPLVGLLGLIRTLPAGVLAPALSVLTDRWPRHRVLLAIHLGRAGLIGLAALIAYGNLTAAAVIAVAALDGLLAVLHRPSHMAMMPSLARSPDDLVAANIASGALEAAGTLLGPVLAGVVVASWGNGPAFALPAILFALAAVAIAGVSPTAAVARQVSRAGSREMLLGGMAALRNHPHAALMLGLFALQTLVRGVLSVLIVVLAMELLAIGEEGVGFLNAAIGAGGFVGALLTMALIGRARMAQPILLGLLMWGLPILALGLLPETWVAFAALGVIGAGNAILDVSGFTLLQRVVPHQARGRVFGVLEANVMLTVGLGAALAPVLVAVAGARGALIVTGLILPLAGLLAWRWVRSADDRAVIPARELALIRGVPMFAQLPMTVLENVAQQLDRRRYAAGTAIVSEGEVGESFFILETGSVEVAQGGAVLHRQGPGSSFGEIALLRDVPRTATVTVVEDAEVMTLGRDAFICAVTDDHLSSEAADRVVRERLAVSGPEG